MNLNLQLFIILMFIFNSNGHTVPILGDIISGAHGVLDGIAHNFNVGGHLGFNLNRKENKIPPKQPETIVVVIKEEDNKYDQPTNGYIPNQNGFRPPPHNHNNGHNPEYNQHKPHHHGPGRPNEHFGHHHDAQPPHGHKPGRPYNHNNNEYNNGNYESQETQRPRPNGYPTYQHQNEYERPDNPSQGNENYGYNNKGQGNNHHNNGHDMRPNLENNNIYGNPDRPNQGDNYPYKPAHPNQGFNNFDQNHNSEHHNNFGSQNNENNNNNNGFESSTGQFHEITSEVYTKKPVSKNTERPNKDTNEPKDDVPFFVPLDVSGADSSDKPPKRETDENKDDDEDLDIDIRIKNE